MYTLDINYFKKQTIVYFLISIFLMVFGLVYEQFSHEVYSNYMIYAFVIPQVIGMLPSMLYSFSIIKKLPNRTSVNLHNAAIATITVYSIMRGILEIYGTTNSLINWYIYIYIIFEIGALFYQKIAH